NTSGIRQPPKESMPAAPIVALYTSMGGRQVTMGSDSHVAETIAFGFDQTYEMLVAKGVDEISTFRDRERTNVPIQDLISRNQGA
ncbi:MAG TPA: hypothetical protein VFQ54_09500, partial [Thermomicrobiales bacterium]|nr:hypothetical protein [Thermomicrobiales bacterium]